MQKDDDSDSDSDSESEAETTASEAEADKAEWKVINAEPKPDKPEDVLVYPIPDQPEPAAAKAGSEDNSVKDDSDDGSDSEEDDVRILVSCNNVEF